MICPVFSMSFPIEYKSLTGIGVQIARHIKNCLIDNQPRTKLFSKTNRGIQ